MFSQYYYAARHKELEVKSICAKLRRIEELNSLSTWAKNKKLPKVEQHYRTLLLQTEDNLFWQTREHKVLLEVCRLGLELYNQLVPSPKFYKPGNAAKYGRDSRMTQYTQQTRRAS